MPSFQSYLHSVGSRILIADILFIFTVHQGKPNIIPIFKVMASTAEPILRIIHEEILLV